MGCVQSNQFACSEIEAFNMNKNTKTIALCGDTAVGKTTLLKSIYGHSITAEHTHQIMKNIRKECICSILYLYHHTLHHLRCISTSAETCFKQNASESIQYLRQNIHYIHQPHSMNTIAHHIDYLWRLPPIKHTFYTQSLVCDSNHDYLLDHVMRFMHPKHRLSANEYLALHHRPSLKLTINKYNDTNINYTEQNIQNIAPIIDSDCIVFVVALNHFCANYTKDGVSTNRLMESVNIFNQIYDIISKQNRPKKLILVLNKIDLFRKYLKYRSLKEREHAFGYGYEGRNYNEKLEDAVFVKIILNYMMEGVQLNVPKDIKRLLQMFCGDLFEEYWLDVCCEDGLYYIQKEFLRSKSCDDVHCFPLCAINRSHARHFLNDITMIVNAASLLF
eukprot:348802_1